MTPDIQSYHQALSSHDMLIAERLAEIIDEKLPEATSKLWHGHPVWFLDENPIVGYSRQKAGMRLMFWSGADFDDDELTVRGNKFKDASIFYQQLSDIDIDRLRHWLELSIDIQWDYKNLVKRKGELRRLK